MWKGHGVRGLAGRSGGPSLSIRVTYSATSIPRTPGDSLAPGEARPLASSSSAPSGWGAPCPPCPWKRPGTPASAQHGRLLRPLSPTLSKQEAPTVPFYSAPRKRHLTPGPVQARSGCNLAAGLPTSGLRPPWPSRAWTRSFARLEPSGWGCEGGCGCKCVYVCVCDSVCVWE